MEGFLKKIINVLKQLALVSFHILAFDISARLYLKRKSLYSEGFKVIYIFFPLKSDVLDQS